MPYLSWLLDGDLAIDEAKAVLGLAELPDEDEYQTLAGFLLYQLGQPLRCLGSG